MKKVVGPSHRKAASWKKQILKELRDVLSWERLIQVAGHEQYWWPFYKNFVPDIYERYATAFRFVLDRGYRPIWIEDGFFGGAE